MGFAVPFVAQRRRGIWRFWLLLKQLRLYRKKYMKILDRIFKGNTLYYPGCATKFAAPFLLDKYEQLLKEIGVDYIKLNNLENCCGSPALNAGYRKEFLEIVEKNLKVFTDHNIKKIITNCPACFKVFAKDYKEALGSVWNIEVEHIVLTLIKAIERKNLQLKKQNIQVTFHDPCHLGKQMGIFEEPRKILEKAGVKIVEMTLTKEKSFCCGGGGGVKSNFPQVAEEMAKERLEMAKETQVNILVTPCPMCYLNMKGKDEKIKVMELSELLEKDE